MQAIIQQIALLASQADETPEQRAARLRQSAQETTADPETLFEVEEDLRGVGRLAIERNEDVVDELEEKIAALALQIGMDPAQARDVLGPETVVVLAAQSALARPAVTALAVKTLHETFERRGLYDELETKVPSQGELTEPVNVDGDLGESEPVEREPVEEGDE